MSIRSEGEPCRPRVPEPTEMRVLLQRVTCGRVDVSGSVVGEIGAGLVALVGVGQGDSSEEADWLADKTAALRVFEDQEGKTNLSLHDVGGSLLVISQFTLYADTSRGRRPSFVKAAPPGLAEELVERFARRVEEQGIPVERGRFGAHMTVLIENDGPVTIMLERNAGE